MPCRPQFLVGLEAGTRLAFPLCFFAGPAIACEHTCENFIDVAQLPLEIEGTPDLRTRHSRSNCLIF